MERFLPTHGAKSAWRKNSQGSPACRSSRSTVGESSVRPQSQDSEDTWPNRSDRITHDCRRGDRITTFFTAARNVCFRHKADIARLSSNVRFSNRPVGVKRFQAVQYSDGNVARGLVLLYGLGT